MSTQHPSNSAILAINPHDDLPAPNHPMPTAAVDRGSPRRKVWALLVVTFLITATGVGVARSFSTSNRVRDRRRVETAAVVGRYSIVVTRRDWPALEPLLAPAFIFHNVEYGSLQERGGFLAWATLIGNSNPGFEVSIDGVRIDEELAEVRFHRTDGDANHTTTSRPIAANGVVRMRIVHQRIVEMWSDYAEFGLTACC